MSVHHSAKTWWLSISVPAWIITIDPLVGITALLVVAMVLLVAE